MKKIPMLLNMKFDDKGNRVITNEINPKAEFLFAAENVIATIKKDGTAAMLTEDGAWMMRRAVNKGKKEPEDFLLAEEDANTGKKFGWEPMENSAFRKFMIKAIENGSDFKPGTFELVGPKINGNPEGVDKEMLLRHGAHHADGFPTIHEIAEHKDDLIGFLTPFFEEFDRDGVEGIVFWADGVPAVKIRVKDFKPEKDSRFKK